MSRSRWTFHAGLAVAVISTATPAWSQSGGAPPQAAGPYDKTLMDVNLLPTLNDPHEVDILFKEGSPITEILEGLNQKGFHIEYRKKQFLPTMTLLKLPEGTVIDDVLREILEPWDFKVFRNPIGKLIVTPTKKSKARVAEHNEKKTSSE